MSAQLLVVPNNAGKLKYEAAVDPMLPLHFQFPHTLPEQHLRIELKMKSVGFHDHEQ